MTQLAQVGPIQAVALSLLLLFSSAEAQKSPFKLNPTPPVRVLPDEAPTPELSDSAVNRLRQYWVNRVREDRLPGAAIGIIQADGLVSICVGHRDATHHSPIDPETIFNIGEATLAFTSLLGATQDGPGASVFDRRATTVTSLFRLTDPQAQHQCRIRDLLAMNAGIPPYTDAILDPQWARPEDVFALLGQAPVMSPPGDHYRPSQASAAVGGYLLAMVVGNRERSLLPNFIDTMQSKLLDPLEMRRTTLQPAIDENVAVGHTADEFGFNPAFPEPATEHPLTPYLGMRTSLQDAAAWINTELSQGVAPSGKRIAPPVNVRERWTPADARSDQQVGLGWRRLFYEETEILLARGTHGLQTAAVGIYPAYRTGFAVFINAEGEAAHRLAEAVTFSIADALKETRQSAVGPPIAQDSAREQPGI